MAHPLDNYEWKSLLRVPLVPISIQNDRLIILLDVILANFILIEYSIVCYWFPSSNYIKATFWQFEAFGQDIDGNATNLWCLLQISC